MENLNKELLYLVGVEYLAEVFHVRSAVNYKKGVGTIHQFTKL
jgi:hypothetical protein